MFRTIRPLVTSAVFSATLFALTATASAMPARPDAGVPAYEPDGVLSPGTHVAEHGSQISTAVWIVAAVAMLAAVAALLTFAASRRHSSPGPVRG